MMENSKEIKERAKVCFNFLIIKQSIKANFKMTNLTGKGYSTAVLLNTQAIFLMENSWVKVNYKLKVCTAIRAILRMEHLMAKEYCIK